MVNVSTDSRNDRIIAKCLFDNQIHVFELVQLAISDWRRRICTENAYNLLQHFVLDVLVP